MDGIFYKLKGCKEWRIVVDMSQMMPDYSNRTHTIHLIEEGYVHLRQKNWNENKGTIAIPYTSIKKIWYM